MQVYWRSDKSLKRIYRVVQWVWIFNSILLSGRIIAFHHISSGMILVLLFTTPPCPIVLKVKFLFNMQA